MFVILKSFSLILIFHCMLLFSSKSIIENGNYGIQLNTSQYLSLSIDQKLIINDTISYFRIYKEDDNVNYYYIETIEDQERLSLNALESDINSNISFLPENLEDKWEFIKESSELYSIKNLYTNKFILVNHTNFYFTEDLHLSTKFRLIKAPFTLRKMELSGSLLDRTPVDVFMKYIDLGDPNLIFQGRPNYKKDVEHAEIKYTLRGVIENLPWVRKIFIVMPNEKVRYLKDDEFVREKFVYIKNKELVNFDSASPFSYYLNFWKLKKFGISDYFLKMDDDFFVTSKLKKSDFFYERGGKIYPYIVNTYNLKLTRDSRTQPYIKDFKKFEENMGKFYCHSGSTFHLQKIRGYRFLCDMLHNNNIQFCGESHSIFPLSIPIMKELYDMLVDKYEYKLYALKGLFRNKLQIDVESFFNTYTFNKYQLTKKRIRNAFLNVKNCLDPITSSKAMPILFPINTGGDEVYYQYDFEFLEICMEYLSPKKTIYEKEDEKNFNMEESIKTAFDHFLEKMGENSNKKGGKYKGFYEQGLELKKKYLGNNKITDVKKVLSEINSLKSKYDKFENTKDTTQKSINEKIADPKEYDEYFKSTSILFSIIIQVNEVKDNIAKIFNQLLEQNINNIEIIFVGTRDNINFAKSKLSLTNYMKEKMIIMVETDDNNINQIKEAVKISKGTYIGIINKYVLLTKTILKSCFIEMEKKKADILEYFILIGSHYQVGNYDNSYNGGGALLEKDEIKDWIYFSPDSVKLIDGNLNGKLIRKTIFEYVFDSLKDDVINRNKNINNYFILIYELSNNVEKYFFSESIGGVIPVDPNYSYNQKEEQKLIEDDIIFLESIMNYIEDDEKALQIVLHQIKELSHKYTSMDQHNKKLYQNLIKESVFKNQFLFEIGIKDKIKQVLKVDKIFEKVNEN